MQTHVSKKSMLSASSPEELSDFVTRLETMHRILVTGHVSEFETPFRRLRRTNLAVKASCGYRSCSKRSSTNRSRQSDRPITSWIPILLERFKSENRSRQSDRPIARPKEEIEVKVKRKRIQRKMDTDRTKQIRLYSIQRTL